MKNVPVGREHVGPFGASFGEYDAFKRRHGELGNMVTLYDVPTEELIDAVADTLADEVGEPDWVPFAKTGAYAELPPEQENFFHRRAASVLRTVAVDGPVGVERLRTRYGGKATGSTRFRVAPEHRADGSGNLIRTILQELEAADLVERPPDGEGRVVTAEGRSLLDTTAGDVLEELDRPELERYA
jgi:small subunit ribosomal protein S19e